MSAYEKGFSSLKAKSWRTGGNWVRVRTMYDSRLQLSLDTRNRKPLLFQDFAKLLVQESLRLGNHMTSLIRQRSL